jgi:hypothetical protein
MAFIDRSIIKVTYGLVDQDQHPSSCQFYVSDASGTLPDINNASFRAFIGEMGDNLAATSDCYVESITVSLALFNDATLAFGAAPDVERKAVLQFKTEDGYETIFTIPGAKYAMFGADGVAVTRNPTDPESFTGNTLAAPLQSIHDKLRNGVTIGLLTHAVTDRRAKDLRQMVDAYKQHRKRSRG